LNEFFRNEKYAGWESIATQLLETGECIVAGKQSIWIGGIGNFIKTEDAKGAIDCTLYKFDLDYFFTSAWFKQIKEGYTEILTEKANNIKDELSDILTLK